VARGWWPWNESNRRVPHCLHGGARREGDSKSGTIALAIAAGGGREAILEFESLSRTIAARRTMRRAPRVASAHALSSLSELRSAKKARFCAIGICQQCLPTRSRRGRGRRRQLSPVRITPEISKRFQSPCNLTAQILSENQKACYPSLQAEFSDGADMHEAEKIPCHTRMARPCDLGHGSPRRLDRRWRQAHAYYARPRLVRRRPCPGALIRHASHATFSRAFAREKGSAAAPLTPRTPPSCRC
jgi:hypothetical protein